MPSLYLDHHGGKLGYRANRLVLTRVSGEETSYPIHQVDRVIVCAHVHVSYDAIAALCKNGIPTALCSSDGWFHGQLSGYCNSRIARRATQYRWMADSDFALRAAQATVRAKLNSQSRMIHQWGTSNTHPLNRYLRRIDRCHDLDTLRGVEGISARRYFQVFRQQLEGTEFKFERRVHHPSPDPVNALLSLGYTLLLSEISLAVETAGMDRFAGFLHAPDGQKPSFALDMMEPLRVLVERLVVQLVRHTLQISDFEHTPQGCYLKKVRRADFYKAWERLLAEPIHWQGRALPYRQLIHAQAGSWAAWFDGHGSELALWHLP